MTTDDEILKSVQETARKFQRRSLDFRDIVTMYHSSRTPKQAVKRQRWITAVLAKARKDSDAREAREDAEHHEKNLTTAKEDEA